MVLLILIVLNFIAAVTAASIPNSLINSVLNSTAAAAAASNYNCIEFYIVTACYTNFCVKLYI